MTERSYFWTTGTSGDGTSTYTQSDMTYALRGIAACNGFEGVAHNYLADYLTTVTGANAISVSTGAGMVDGKIHVNDAAVAVTIPSSSGGTERIDRIVLRASWAAFTVRITRIAGVEGASPSAPAITQVSHTTYDIQLYQARVNSSGTVTLTDERTFARQNNITRRQGGSATVWATAGATNYLVGGDVKIQVGSVSYTYGAAAYNVGGAITFPTAFTYAPVIITGHVPASVHAGAFSETVELASVANTGFTINLVRTSNADGAVATVVYWMAIGI